jgi:hypothetical protein
MTPSVHLLRRRGSIVLLDATYGLAARDLVEELRALAEWATFVAP